MADISAQPMVDFGSLLTSYPRNQANIENTQAQTGLAGAQTQQSQASTALINTQAKKMGLEVQMIQQALGALDKMNDKDEEKSGVQASANAPSEAGIASTLNKKFFVDPMGPPGLQQYINATAWVNPAEAQRAEEMRKTMVASQTSKNANEANDIFQTSTALADTDHPLQSLLTLRPGSYLNNVGRAISTMPDKTPEEKDALAQNAIRAAGKYSHQYTGREITQAGDEYRDKATGFPVQAPKIGPTAGEQIGLGQWLNTPQKVTIDNRDTTIKPKDLGISGYQDLTKNKSIKFSVPPPGGKPTAPGETAKPGTPQDVAQTEALKSAGLGGDQISFVKDQPAAFPKVKGNSTLNADDMKQRDIYRDQAKKLAETSSLSAVKAQGTLTNLQRINQVLSAPNLKLGPGSREYTQLETVFSQWFGSPTGQAPAYQILSKFLNADQMNRVLSEFHGEGAQVRLGAYESRLIMEQLAASPQMTKEAIQQMLKWQASDSQYEYQKAKTGAALAVSGKQVADFDAKYSAKFPKNETVDTTLSAFKSGKTLNYTAMSGKSFTVNQAKEAADHYGIPYIQFTENLRKAGATVQ